MKKILITVLGLAIMSMSLMAQESAEDVQQEIDEAMIEVQEALEQIPGTSEITIDFKNLSGEKPKMGVYLSDMDFEDAYEKHYPYCYGVFVTGVTTGGPAQMAGIIKGDIIMEFDGKKAKFENHLVNLITSKNIGEEVKVKIFRDEEELITNLTLETLNPKGTEATTKDGVKKKKKLSVGFGGGGWMPIWYTAADEFEDINYILNEFGFQGISEKGILMQGGGGHGNVGRGWFIGGMGASYSIDKKKGYTTLSGDDVTRRMNYSNSFGGVTLDKRFAFTKNMVSSLGFMLGWGGHNLQISQTDGSYDWLTLNDDMDSSSNNAIEIEKNYIMFQPKAVVMYKILDWLSIRAEGGYIISHSFTNGWNAISCDDDFEIENSPETSFDGYTISIGPWFGF
ncbi:MAG: PDZ domain-containing protein [Candidatus Tenebribacter davisii]|nr:PDZ domain-containing protein [Candidatus Tenebribacter davisii]